MSSESQFSVPLYIPISPNPCFRSRISVPVFSHGFSPGFQSRFSVPDYIYPESQFIYTPNPGLYIPRIPVYINIFIPESRFIYIYIFIPESRFSVPVFSPGLYSSLNCLPVSYCNFCDKWTFLEEKLHRFSSPPCVSRHHGGPVGGA